MEQHKLLSSQVSLTGFQTVTDTAGSHVAYTVEVSWGERPWTVLKRYNDFRSLDAHLEKCYGKRQVPHMTRSTVGAFVKGVGGDETFLRRRMQKLEQYFRYVVEYIDHWALQGDTGCGVGWGVVLGINQIIFEFLNVGARAVMPPPRTAVIVGKTVIHASDIPDADTNTLFDTGRDDAHRFVAESVLDVFLRTMLDLSNDDDRLSAIDRDLAGLTKSGQVGLNCIQACAIIRTLYFGDARLAAMKEVVRHVIDVRCLDVLLDAFDFDEDEAVVRALFAGKV